AIVGDNSQNLILKNLTITNLLSFANMMGAIALVACQNIEITDCRIWNSHNSAGFSAGIFVQLCNNVLFKNSNISQLSTGSDFNATAFGHTCIGIYLLVDASVTIDSVIVSNVTGSC